MAGSEGDGGRLMTGIGGRVIVADDDRRVVHRSADRSASSLGSVGYRCLPQGVDKAVETVDSSALLPARDVFLGTRCHNNGRHGG